MVPAVDPAVKPCRRSIGRRRRSPAPAGTRSRAAATKPQVKAQTDLLPAREGAAATTSSSASRSIMDWYRLGINGTSGPYPLFVSRRRHVGAPTASGSSTPARRQITAPAGTSAEHRSALQRVLRSGSLGAEQPPDDHRRPAHRLPEPSTRRYPEALIADSTPVCRRLSVRRRSLPRMDGAPSSRRQTDDYRRDAAEEHGRRAAHRLQRRPRRRRARRC